MVHRLLHILDETFVICLQENGKTSLLMLQFEHKLNTYLVSKFALKNNIKT